MSLVSSLLHTIDQEWNSQDFSGDDSLYVLVEAVIHPSLAKAIESSGEVVPKTFDPNTFNGREEDNWFPISISVQEQDELIQFLYE